MGREPKSLTGRDLELAQIGSALDSVASAELVVVELTGPLGIGKTALMDRLAAAAMSRGFVCLEVTGSRAERDQPFAALVALLDSVLSTDEFSSELDQYDVADLATVIPGLRGSARPELVASTPDLQLICRAVGRALALLSSTSGGVVLLVDDLQWVDEATASVIDYLIRHGVGDAALIVTARRPVEPAIPAFTLRNRVAGLHVPVALGPLDDASVEQILAGFPGADRAWVLREAGGNPLFVTELAAYAASSQSAEGEGRAEQDSPQPAFPRALSETILAELAELSRNARRLAQAGAVLGDPFEVVRAGELAGLTHTDIYTAVDELVASTLVMADDDRGSFRFRHPVIGSVIYQGTPHGQRMASHAQAATLLSAAGAGQIEIAGHLERCAVVGDVEAIEVISEAATASRGLAPKTSVRLYAAAIRLVPPAGPLSSRRWSLLNSQADCLIVAGRFREANEVLTGALAEIPESEALQRAALLANLVRLQRWLGPQEGAIDFITKALAEIPEGSVVAKVGLESLLMLVEAERGNSEAVQRLAAQTRAGAQGVGWDYLSLIVEAAGASCEVRTGDANRAFDHYRAAIAHFDALIVQQPLGISEGLFILASAEEMLGQDVASLQHAEQGLECTRSGINNELHSWFGLVAESVMTRRGDPVGGALLLEEIEQVTRMLDNTSMHCLVLARRSLVAMMLGDVGEAERLARDAQVLLQFSEGAWFFASVSVLLSPVLVELGEPAAAVDLVLTNAGGPGLDHVPYYARASAYEYLTIAELLRGDVVAARSWADHARGWADRMDLPWSVCAAGRAHGRVLIAEGLLEEAVRAATGAIDAAETAEAPIEAGQARVIAGEALAAVGRTQEAVEMFLAALAAFEDAGTRRLAAKVAKELRRLGVRSAGARAVSGGAGGTGLSGLSGREEEVARLVAEGLTNRLIAERLVLSQRTVESHLRRIFIKLNARSRSDVIDTVRREQLTEQVTGRS